jgi:membrane-associated phospholipid phosphatase
LPFLPSVSELVRVRRPWRFWARHGLAWLALPLALLLCAGWVAAHGLDAPLLRRANALLLQRGPDGLPHAALAVWWSCLSLAGRALGLLILFLLAARRRPDWTAAGLVVLLLGGLVVDALKGAIAAPRPPALLTAGEIHILGQALKERSMPSGHAAGAFAAAAVVLLSRGYGRAAAWAVPLALGLATAVALSRLAAGVHWPRDVLAGAAVGWLFGALAVLLAARSGLTAWVAGWHGQRAAVLALLLAGVLMAGLSMGYPQGVAAQVLLALAAVGVALHRARGLIDEARRRPPAGQPSI